MIEEERFAHLVNDDCSVPEQTPTFLYCRDSGGEDQDESVAQQIAVAMEYIKRHNLKLRNTYQDEAQVSTNTEKRLRLKQMMTEIEEDYPIIEDAKKREVFAKTPRFALILWKLNRLSRDIDYRNLVRANIAMRGGVFICLKGEPPTGNKTVDGLLTVLNDIHDSETLKQIAGDASRGLGTIVSMRDTNEKFRAQNPDWPTCDGRYLSISPGVPPVGFRGEEITVGIKERKKKTGLHREMHKLQRFVPDERDNVWERCKMAWKMRTEGQDIEAINKATHLYKTTGGYSGFFKNRIYTGDYEYGGAVYHGFVPAIVSKEDFEAEQKRINERSQKLKGKMVPSELEPRRVASRHLLTGLVFCGAIAGELHPMHADTISANEKRSQWDFYMCSRKKASHSERCNAARVGAKALEEVVVEKIMSEIITRDNLRPLADGLAKALTERNTTVGAQLAALQGQLDKLDRAIEQLLDAVEEGNDLGLATLKKRLGEREAEKAKLESEIASQKKSLTKKSDIPTITDLQIDEYIALVRNALSGDDTALAQRIIKRLVAKVVIQNEMGTIYYTFPFQDLSRDGTMPLRGFGPRF